ncbi:plasmid replication, integration and excision activator [Actinoallomurus purpureus]|uniref:plasmid replication, integration and excision activator n=1 Tax=Actinoallomurus purpureus TaxID=478114 RepID=UPI0027E2AEFB|nr:plasmid replication, integration and excision activator [Actinoallomurus purpureus]
MEFGFVFPHGAFVRGQVEPVRDFDKSTKDNQVQARDKESGERVWQVEVIDADPNAKGSVKVKLFGEHQPVPPAPSGGFPFAAVEFDGLTVTPYVDSKTDRLAYSFRAKAIRDPKGAAKAAPSAGKAAA